MIAQTMNSGMLWAAPHLTEVVVPQRGRVVQQVAGAVLLPVERVDLLRPPVLRRVLHEEPGGDDADGHDDALDDDVVVDLAVGHVGGARTRARRTDDENERDRAVGPAAVDEPGPPALLLRVPLGHDVDAARVDHPGADAAERGIAEVRGPDRGRLRQPAVGDHAADDAADDHRPAYRQDPAITQIAGGDLDEGLEDYVEGEEPERWGRAPVVCRGQGSG